MLRILTITLAVAFGLGQARAEDPKGMSPEALKKAMEEAGKPGAEHKKLEPCIGTFTITAKMWMDPSKSPMETKGTADRKWVFGGRFIEETVTGKCEVTGLPFEGLGLIGYDNLKKKYVMTWVDNMSTATFHVEGTSDVTGRKIEFSGETMCPITKGPVHTRTVMNHVTDDKQVLEMYMTMEGKESKVCEITYERKK